ncbi:MAG: tRNA (N6-threonylcarbamoyladenosine(37)-N6)-methyltransferase TrmO [Gammaproteobacteria bacterium]|nr:tRNA (N6-threonylcarbamoyladenosine(37)-N6)-methyltransferase TrmO [Gammaproteobacteria bacterium]
MKIELQTIGLVHSPYKEKFGVPRQPGLVPQAKGSVEMLPPFNRPEAFVGLQGYSHIWLQFIFDRALRARWQPTVRPPRLGGNRRVGVFASRAPFRPNPIGLSVVRLEGVSTEAGSVLLKVSGLDLVDGTPVIDIKPYLAYVDSIPDAASGFAAPASASLCRVRFTSRALNQLAARPDGETLKEMITALLAADPRPAYIMDGRQQRVYGIRLYDFDLRWQLVDGVAQVLELAQPDHFSAEM